MTNQTDNMTSNFSHLRSPVSRFYCNMGAFMDRGTIQTALVAVAISGLVFGIGLGGNFLMGGFDPTVLESL